jgi:hypothetical protein
MEEVDYYYIKDILEALDFKSFLWFNGEFDLQGIKKKYPFLDKIINNQNDVKCLLQIIEKI